MVKVGAPFSDHPKLLELSTAPGWVEIGDGKGVGVGDVFREEGTETVPDSFGVIVGVGVGVGVAVEMRTGGAVGVGVGVAVADSVGAGGCPKTTTMTPRSATTESP